jgi:DNA-binding response OmpR family regulator
VLVIDDGDPAVREAVARLGAAGYTVVAEHTLEGLQMVADVFRPDVAVIAANGTPPAQVVGVVRRHDAIPVILLTGTSVEERLAGFAAGADDVVVKPLVPKELVMRVGVLLQRTGFHRDVTRVADVVIDQAAHVVTRNGHELDLTTTEFNLLRALCRHAPRVRSKHDLLVEVWGFEHYHVNLVEVHVSALRRKLEQHGGRLIHTVRSAGYVVRVPKTSPTLQVEQYPA